MYLGPPNRRKGWDRGATDLYLAHLTRLFSSYFTVLVSSSLNWTISPIEDVWRTLKG